MKRKWNWSLWLGFALALFAALSYESIFVRFPITRDFPWLNLTLFVPVGLLLAIGLRRAFDRPAEYRGRIAGPILTLISVAIFGFFCFGVFYVARDIPNGSTAVKAGQTAPDFTLTDTEGQPVKLSQLRQGKRAVLLIFYRGYW